MSRLDAFVAPKPNRALIRTMTGVNRVVMLKGVPGFRDLAPFDRLPGLRGIANVRHIDLPTEDQARLAASCGPGKATFITPNHPEFFTDWMIDKEIIARVSPLAACWATDGIVNGLGRAMQKFWLANNLIAQIPGNSEAAREHSIRWALKGQGVLLHPEGQVGWHGDYIAPLLPGAVEMALEALRHGWAQDPNFKVFVAPVVWKLVFLRDVEPALIRECAYVEKHLGIEPPRGLVLPERVHHVYSVLLERDEKALGLAASSGASYAARHEAVVAALCERLAKVVQPQAVSGESEQLLRLARRWMRTNPDAASEVRKTVKADVDRCVRVLRVGPFAYRNEQITQEEIAEHLKRIRNDYCKGSLRDTINRFVPQPVGPRRAHIRVPEPLTADDLAVGPEQAVGELRQRMQRAIDGINAMLRASGSLTHYPNPFHIA